MCESEASYFLDSPEPPPPRTDTCETCHGKGTIGVCLGCGSLADPAYHQSTCTRPAFTQVACPGGCLKESVVKGDF